MDMKLELVPLPVADIDRSIAFYVQGVGFHLDHDVQNGAMRVVQMTPPGSACSVVIGTGMGIATPPGSVKGLHLVVEDINAARDLLVGRGLSMGEVVDMGGIKYVFFSDPDDNTWALQEVFRQR